MPSVPHSRLSGPAEPQSLNGPSTSYGQVIEYIQERLYLASYTHPPTPQTPFPYPIQHTQSPSKRTSKSFNASISGTSTALKRHPPTYFTVDTSLLYNAFHADFGPLHIGHLYRFAVQLHEVLGDPENENRAVVFWSHTDSRSRANAACILACYMVLIQSWPPHLALAPISQMDPPLMPFRDAGYSQADFILTVQDVVYGVWKAKEDGLCGLKDFNLEEYETFERVDMGDFNWITPGFVAFASPQHSPTDLIPQSSSQYAALPSSTSALEKANIPMPFKNVLAHFRARNVGLVVRLNSELYSPSYFTAMGIHHLDMIFDDGTCPPLSLVRKFIKIAHDMISVRHRSIAVHCKAGLGRTGCLIGAYLIYRYGFTANEVIAFMRFMRPGMVVGPQQHWLHLNQGAFREWWFEDCIKEKLALLKQVTPTKTSPCKKQQHHLRLGSNGQTMTPPNGGQKRAALGEINDNSHRTSSSGQYASTVQDENLPAPTPGQPRKTGKIYGDRLQSPFRANDDSSLVQQPGQDNIAIEQHARCGENDALAEDELQLHVLSRHKSSRSPSSVKESPRNHNRAISCTTTTTTTMTEWTDMADIPLDKCETSDSGLKRDLYSPLREQRRSGSGSGAGVISVGKTRSSPSRSRSGGGAISGGVRKTSGRIGSGSTSTAVARIK